MDSKLIFELALTPVMQVNPNGGQADGTVGVRRGLEGMHHRDNKDVKRLRRDGDGSPDPLLGGDGLNFGLDGHNHQGGDRGGSENMAIDNALLQPDRAHLQSQATEAFHQYQLRQQHSAPQGPGPAQQRYEQHNANADVQSNHDMQQGGGAKPSVGSDEWHRLRKDSHKEVEKRRRQTINQGIEELKKIVPDCDKHKGQILKNAVEYIKKLKENEQQNIEKLTLEKLLTEQAIAELSASNKALKAQLAQAWKEVEHWKHLCGELSKGKDLPQPPRNAENSTTA